jgi:hypothetical protein
MPIPVRPELSRASGVPGHGPWGLAGRGISPATFHEPASHLPRTPSGPLHSPPSDAAMSITVDDLIASFGSNHIGQEAMDIASLQVRVPPPPIPSRTPDTLLPYLCIRTRLSSRRRSSRTRCHSSTSSQSRAATSATSHAIRRRRARPPRPARRSHGTRCRLARRSGADARSTTA